MPAQLHLRVRCHTLRAVVVIVLAIGMASSTVAQSRVDQGQSRDGELRQRLLGTFETRPPRAPPAGSSPDHAWQPSRRSEEQDAHRLLEDARDDLLAGHERAARRQLEVLVQRHPETAAANEARQVLRRLYTLQPADAHVPAGNREDSGASKPRLNWYRGRDTTERGPAAKSQATARQTAWTDQVRRAQLNQEFRTFAGDRLFFSNGSAELGARARQVMSFQAQWLARHSDMEVTIEAHADDAGGTDLNNDLARRRAETVRQRLIEEGIPAERIRMLSHGRERRVAPCPDPACSAQNRRVVMTLGDPAPWPHAETAPRSASGPLRRP